jgi:four helix bundle protein
MAGVQTFTELHFWQRARQWSKAIFQLTQRKAFSDDRRLVEQINDSSESVGANIAEGFGRGTQGEFVQFLGYANGSLNETQSHLCAAYDREYITKDEFAELFQEGTEIRKMMIGFVTSMIKPGSGVKNLRKVIRWSEECWQRYERITGRQRPAMFRSKGDEDDEGGPVMPRATTFRPSSDNAGEGDNQVQPYSADSQRPKDGEVEDPGLNCGKLLAPPETKR